MPADPIVPNTTGAALAAALRSVRELRHLRQTDVAKALDVSPRSYQDLEAGSGRLQLDQLAAFTAITNSDQLALVAAVIRRSPSLAVRAADSKAMTIMMRLVEDFLNALGERSDKLRPNDLISAVRPVLMTLARELAEREEGPSDPPFGA